MNYLFNISLHGMNNSWSSVRGPPLGCWFQAALRKYHSGHQSPQTHKESKHQLSDEGSSAVMRAGHAATAEQFSTEESPFSMY